MKALPPLRAASALLALSACNHAAAPTPTPGAVEPVAVSSESTTASHAQDDAAPPPGESVPSPRPLPLPSPTPPSDDTPPTDPMTPSTPPPPSA